MDNINWKVTIAVIIALVVGIFAGLIFAPKQIGYTYEEVQNHSNEQVAIASAPLNAEIFKLEQKIIDLQVEEIIVELDGYLIDGLFLEEVFVEETFSDRELNLFDGEVEFDGDDYDAEETLTLKYFILKANDNDFEGNVYMTVQERAVEYTLTFEDGLTELVDGVDEEETLVFNFLGDRYEVSKWDTEVITLTRGTEHKLEVGEVIEVGGKEVHLDAISEDSRRVYVEVDGVGRSISEWDTKIVNGLEIKVNDVFYSGTYAFASLTIGEDIKVTIEDGDEYAEDSIWEWVIGPNTIGLVLVEEFTELEEDYNALTEGDKICLPNDYVCVLFNGVIEEDSEVYTFELEENNSVRVKGNFEFETEDYDEIYVYRVNGSIYEDDDLESYIGEEVEFSNSDLVLSADTDRILINDTSVSEGRLVWIGLDLTQIKVDWDVGDGWNNITSNDENFLTNYGILVENPEDSIKDQEFKITVPEERLEAELTVK